MTSDRPSAPRVSVIVPVYGDQGEIRRCLDALRAQTLPQELFEVIIVDNGANPQLGGIVEAYPFARIVREDRRGSYAARNAGARAAMGAVLAFTDSDCAPEPDWLARGGEALASHDVAAIAGQVKVPLTADKSANGTLLYERVHAFPQREYVERHHFGVTANLWTHAWVFEAVGAFDPSLASGGDAEWGRRLKDWDLEIAYDESVVVAHPPRDALRQLLRKVVRVTRGQFALAARGERPGVVHETRSRLGRAAHRMRTPTEQVALATRASRFRYRGVVLSVAIVSVLESWRLRAAERFRIGVPGRAPATPTATQKGA